MKSFLAILSLLPLALADPTVYLIRHGEKPADGGDGLSAQGMDRAQCLKNVFGPSSQYDIGYILAQDYKAGGCPPLPWSLIVNLLLTVSDGSRMRPYDTVLPLSQELGLTVDHHCDRDDPDCVNDAVKSYTGSGNILICWEHKELTDIVEALGAKSKNAPTYPDDSYNIIWTDPSDYKHITAMTSEDCPGLDD